MSFCCCCIAIRWLSFYHRVDHNELARVSAVGRHFKQNGASIRFHCIPQVKTKVHQGDIGKNALKDQLLWITDLFTLDLHESMDSLDTRVSRMLCFLSSLGTGSHRLHKTAHLYKKGLLCGFCPFSYRPRVTPDFKVSLYEYRTLNVRASEILGERCTSLVRADDRRGSQRFDGEALDQD